MKSLLFIVLAFLFTDVNRWLTYTDSKNNFQIKYPLDWELKESPRATVFLCPLENEEDNFQENISIIVEDLVLEEDMTIDKYGDLMKQKVIKEFGPHRFSYLKDIKIGEMPGKELAFTIRYKKKRLRIKQFFVVNDGKAITFTFTGEPDHLEGFEPDILTSLSTLTFVD